MKTLDTYYMTLAQFRLLVWIVGAESVNCQQLTPDELRRARQLTEKGMTVRSVTAIGEHFTATIAGVNAVRVVATEIASVWDRRKLQPMLSIQFTDRQPEPGGSIRA